VTEHRRPHDPPEPEAPPTSMPARKVLFAAQVRVTCAEMRRCARMLREMRWSSAAAQFDTLANELEHHPATIEAGKP